MLATQFGRDAVFFDLDTLEPGLDFVRFIEEAVTSCAALVAVIDGALIEAEPKVLAKGERPYRDAEVIDGDASRLDDLLRYERLPAILQDRCCRRRRRSLLGGVLRAQSDIGWNASNGDRPANDERTCRRPVRVVRAGVAQATSGFQTGGFSKLTWGFASGSPRRARGICSFGASGEGAAGKSSGCCRKFEYRPHRTNRPLGLGDRGVFALVLRFVPDGQEGHQVSLRFPAYISRFFQQGERLLMVVSDGVMPEATAAHGVCSGDACQDGVADCC